MILMARKALVVLFLSIILREIYCPACAFLQHASNPILDSSRFSCQNVQGENDIVVSMSGGEIGLEKSSKQPGSNDINNDSKCPFSMTFTRNRIDVSSGKRNERIASQNPFSGLKAKLDRARLELKYKSQVNDGRFRWVDLDSAVKSEDRNNNLPLGGVEAMSAFWRAVSDLSEISEMEAVEGIQRTLVLALPGVTQLTAIRMLEIYDWLVSGTLNGELGINDGSEMPVVRATLDKDAPIPVIVLMADATSVQKSLTVSNPEKSLVVEERIKAWVRRVLVNLGICPFTKSDSRSGQGLADLNIPVARIAYHHSVASIHQIALLMADTWEAIHDMISAGPSGRDGVSSILLAAPGFDDYFPLWAGPVFAMLEASVGVAEAESLIGIVCFHPKYATPDGKSWPGFGHMHSVPRLRGWLDDNNIELSSQLTDEEVAAGGAWQRRTPHAVINVLRADQLAAAEGRRSSSSLYTRNIDKLMGKTRGVGSGKLAASLSEERQLGR